MSFFGTVISKFNQGKEQFAKETSRFKNKDFSNAVIGGSVLLPIVDGKIPVQKKLLKFIQRSDELKVFDKSDIIQSFQSLLNVPEFDDAIGKDKCPKRSKEKILRRIY